MHGNEAGDPAVRHDPPVVSAAQVSQDVQAERDAYVAGRDMPTQNVNVYVQGAAAPGKRTYPAQAKHIRRKHWVAIAVGIVAAAAGLIAAAIVYMPGSAHSGTPRPAVAATGRFMTVQLATVAPGTGGDIGLPLWVSDKKTFHYAVSTKGIGQAGCRCVPPWVGNNPDGLTLAFMPATTCRSISLTVAAPWWPPGDSRPSLEEADKAGADRVSLIQNGHVTADVFVDGSKPLASVQAPLTGGEWEIRVYELAYAADTNGSQASVFIDGTLSCTTPTGA